MPVLQHPKPKKIIQKRVARRERFARMARIRYRKERNEIIARVQDLDLPPKYEPQNLVFEGPLGLMMAETQEGLYSELSLLNDYYVSNSITVQNDKNQILSVKLHKNDHKDILLKEHVLDEWEKRSNPYWIDWAKHMKSFRTNFKQFIDKNQDKLEANKIDDESFLKQKIFAAKRDELMSKRACYEIRTRLSKKGCAASEIIFNAGFVNKLNYEFQEFVQKVLMEGIPRLRPLHNRSIKKNAHFYNHFENVFNDGYECSYKDSLFLAKDFNHTEMDYNIVAGGYFVKNAAEMSFIFVINDSKALSERENFSRPIHRLYMEQQMFHEAESKHFIEVYYKEEMAKLMFKPKEIYHTRACIGKIEEEGEEETHKDCSGNNIQSDDLVLKDHVDFQNKEASNEVFPIPYKNYLAQTSPQIHLMKVIYQKQQNVLNLLLQENFKHYLTKQE